MTYDPVKDAAVKRHVAHAAQTADTLRVLRVTSGCAARDVLKVGQTALVKLDDSCRSYKHCMSYKIKLSSRYSYVNASHTHEDNIFLLMVVSRSSYTVYNV